MAKKKKSRKPEEMHLNELYWQMVSEHVFTTETKKQAQERVQRCSAAVAWFNTLTYGEQQHVRLLMESAERDGYESCQSEHGEGP